MQCSHARLAGDHAWSTLWKLPLGENGSRRCCTQDQVSYAANCMLVCLSVSLSVCQSVSLWVWSGCLSVAQLGWLVVDTQVQACSRGTHSPSQATGIYLIRTQCLSNNTHTCTHHCYQQWSRTDYSTPHTLWDCAVELASVLIAATIVADAAVTPPSLKWPKMCQVGC